MDVSELKNKVDHPAGTAAREEAARIVGKATDDWRFPWIRAVLLLMAAIWLLRFVWNHPTGQEVMMASFRLVTGILSTPLLLETAWFCLGALALYLYTLRRRHREGDEWVVMEVDESLQEPVESATSGQAAHAPDGMNENSSGNS